MEQREKGSPWWGLGSLGQNRERLLKSTWQGSRVGTWELTSVCLLHLPLGHLALKQQLVPTTSWGSREQIHSDPPLWASQAWGEQEGTCGRHRMAL